MKTNRLALFTGGFLVVGGFAHAQCKPEWLAGPPKPYWGFTPQVMAVIQYQGDFYIGGMGPGESWGLFMRWNGLGWTWMQPPDAFFVDWITVFREFKNELYVGGVFSFGGGGVARWDGSKASSVGGGVSGSSVPTVFAMLESNDSLIVGGRFQTAGAIPVNNIARWDGTEWHAMGDGLGGLTYPHVYGLAEHDGSIYASTYGTIGGDGNIGVARWTGTLWQSLELPYPAEERTWKAHLASFDGQLFLAAQFAKLIYPYANEIRTFRFDGTTWHQNAQVGPGGQPRDLRVINGHLLLIASNLVGPANNNLATWSGGEWVPFEGGSNGGVSSMASFGNGVIFAGNAAVAPGSIPFARWGCFCKPDCDENAILDINDFICFQTLFATNDERADCDADTLLTIDDFVCFQSVYAVGC